MLGFIQDFSKAIEKAREELLDIVFDRVEVPKIPTGSILPRSVTDDATLYLMEQLIKIEFHAGLLKEIENPDEAPPKLDPHPYDVFTVQRSFKTGNISIVVCIPDLVFQDENGKIWGQDKLRLQRKVASLSGPARVLANLKVGVAHPLMRHAMERVHIYDIASILDPPLATTSTLNESQRRAVSVLDKAVSRFHSGFFIVQGPPGTGKSTTIVQMVKAANEPCIVAAPSNAATASIAMKIFQSSNYSIAELCVFGGNSDPSVDFLNPTIRREKFHVFSKKYGEFTTREKRIKALRDFCLWLHLGEEEENFRYIPHGEDLDNDDDLELTNRVICKLHDEDLNDDENFLELTNRLFRILSLLCNQSDEWAVQNSQIIFCTLNSSGSVWLRNNSGGRRTFFLDEAGQCNEAEFYLATTFPSVERVVVVGDPMQLPPTVISKTCEAAGFGRSWMANVYDEKSGSIHLLDTQYRMDPAILRFPNKLFYGNRIISDDSVKNRHPKVIRPFGFVDTRGSQEEREKYSVKNAQEAAIIRSLLRNEEEVTKLLGQNAKVVVITPYKAQKKLLEDELSKVATLNQWCVSTVDSFQGQEADIVILSTVRTEAVGFVDNPQRLNVALTRAKRLMIVVGNKQLFQRLKSSSILQKLSAYADKIDGNFTVDIKTNIYSMPDWRNKTLWKPFINARFHNCIKKIAEKSKKDHAVIWNVIYTLALPEVSCLVPRPNPKSFWQVTSFSKHPQCSIVWVGKTGMSFEVHFAGSREECLRFIQLHAENVPAGSCKVSSDMLSIINDTVNEENDNTTFTPSWETTNVIQKAIFEHTIEHLPLGTLKLDPDQQLIASQQPPLILESRSGTGKTNVLFQHALNFARELGDNRKFNDICFITVSKRLSSNLKARYDEIWKIESEPLQGCIFLSLSDFLDGLAKMYNLPMDTADCKTFNEYMFHRKSHVVLKTNLNVQLIENEIGGVILGSLRSARLCRPLSWTEYKDDKRSNIVGDNATKHDIYSQYELYKKWKQDHGYFDVYDMVLELIKKFHKKPQQFFSGVYLDEVQDFSYSMMYLICSVGGKLSQNWIFAGDTAQMVSPGCSFKFAGLKEVLLAISPGIESKLKKVSHLLKNYRTTKNILDVGNAILTKAKKYYPGAIEFAKKEQAINDNGLKVVLVDWDSAVDQTSPIFGRDQALIYSFSMHSEKNNKHSLRQWLGNHPFILNVIESKGLEFDDVVVAFDLQRSSWKIESGQPDALVMIRELYVAVTRAKQRVVILVKKQSDAMLKFLSTLDYSLQYDNAIDVLFQEFNCNTSDVQWLERADDLFSDQRYDIASRCYDKGKNLAMAAWARSKHFHIIGKMHEARKELLDACKLFDKENNPAKVLDLSIEFLDVSSWEDDPPDFGPEKMFQRSYNSYPHHLTRDQLVKIGIFQDSWNCVTVQDIESQFKFVMRRRGFPGLMKFLDTLHDTELEKISQKIPLSIGDLYYKHKEYLLAVQMYLHQGLDDSEKDYVMANKCAELLLDCHDMKGKPHDFVYLFQICKPYLKDLSKSGNKRLKVFITLMNDPEAASESNPSRFMKMLNPALIEFAVLETKTLPHTILHRFCKELFHEKVLQYLSRVEEKAFKDIVMWFFKNDDHNHAEKVFLEHTAEWTVEDLRFLHSEGFCTESFAKALFKKSLLKDAIKMYLDLKKTTEAIDAFEEALKASMKDVEDDAFHITHILIMKVGLCTLLGKEVPHWTGLIIKLFTSVIEMNESQCKAVIKHFGCSIVQEFVIRKSPHYTKQKQYIDACDILKKFGKDAYMSIYGILKGYLDYGIKYEDFVDHHIKWWTKEDLVRFAKEYDICTKTLADELYKRYCFADAANMYIKLNFFENGIEASEKALGSAALAKTNATEIRNIWLTDKFRARYKKSIKPGDHRNLYLLLLLFQDPLKAGQTYHFNWVHYFGKDLVIKAVLGHSPYKNSTDDEYEDECSILAKKFNLLDLVTKDYNYILNHYKGRRDFEGASRFANKHITVWSNDDLHQFFYDEKLILPNLPKELYKRKMFYLAFHAFFKLKNFSAAADASNMYLHSSKVTMGMVDNMRSIWCSDNSIKKLIYDSSTNSLLWLLCSLFNDPESTLMDHHHECFKFFEERVIKEAVLNYYIDNQECSFNPSSLLSNTKAKKDGCTLKNIDELEVFRYLLDREEMKAVERYLNSNRDLWKSIFHQMSDREVKVILEYGGDEIMGIEEELKNRRTMDMELIQFYLRIDSVSNAICQSYKVLQNPKLSEMQAKQMFYIWKERQNQINDDDFCTLIQEKSGIAFCDDQQEGELG